MVTNKFIDRSVLLTKINDYILVYKPRFRLPFADRVDTDDSIDIDFHDLCINSFDENREEDSNESCNEMTE